ncbi:hypothetical protein [Paenibacillus tengchongensis]|uniref:hypothetical protein n=1 Tax=Paenibacillus tengchongensis TaxID=2608684 RepID=UPI00124DDBD4|nr:hypothetical protein [Paenibacillus tengchongensis]
MDKFHVAAGRIIEIHNDRVITLEGDMICTYHPRYYTVPAEYDQAEEAMKPELHNGQREEQSPRRRNLAWPWFPLHKKSANRI